MMVFNFKGGIRLFSQRLNRVIDQLDPVELSLIETLLGIAVTPQEVVTVTTIQDKLGLTASELTHYLNRLACLDLITWTSEAPVQQQNA
ncbi:hypothetical protein KB236_04210 [Levilactobacillus brevis]|uniref:Uncharacterized protein n=1 Tax=Levilactobacillus hammesii TaxID=267633 RepID=A0A921F190_9LACO|nr:hypothetical protein KB236_04210 [Levilactobacillus brevis]HJE86974.1 hypothetical protein [Levilactobacillus hammesii]